ncbi:hypothetical protein QBC37DRAFT_372965 [Rhypophila decipiens]|uniref:Uncharacterized protein n=1 Tax=Rhypophila decipiens TaxID=261697 RepID=A0AAN6Y8L3_9PEZI|nr:hypothetical protein QBC37DRAFT_372965 [Rhypophila decipiens]
MLSTLRHNGPMALLLLASLLEGYQALGATVPRNIQEPKGELHDRHDPGLNETAYQVAFVAGMGYSFKSLYEDCRSAKDPDGKVAEGHMANCVGAAITAVAGIVSAMDLSARAIGSIREFHINNPNFLPPLQNWRNNMHDSWFGHGNGKTKRAMLMPRGHDDLQALSKRLGSEVRHVGYWTDNESRIARRGDKPNEVPVLAARVTGGEDMHYAYLGEDSDGKHHFKMGLGLPEQATEEALLAKRADDDDPDPWLHGAFFTKGGINFWGQPDPTSPFGTMVSEEVWVDTDEEFGWLYKATMCTLRDYWFQDPMKGQAMHFQVYNRMDSSTLSVGAMAPFDENGNSAIEEFQEVVSGIDTHEKCMQKLGFDIQKKQ